MKLRAMTFNIQHGYDYLHKQMDIGRMCDVISSLGADIVCVNEVRGEGTYPDEPAILSARTGMKSVFGPALKDTHGEYGNLLLSRFPIISSEIKLIAVPDVKTGGSMYEPRSIIRAVIGTEPNITVIAAHFGLNVDEQVGSVRAACDMIDSCNMPCIMMGDFNCVLDAPVLRPLLDRLCDASRRFCPDKLSYDSINPTIKIDYVLTSKDIKVLNADIPDIIASDHRPHYADIEI